MREPITQKDMRYGDLIRWESDTSDTAREFRITDPNSRPTGPGAYYLLDRPAPAVDLPTEPTLGWVVSKYGGSALGTWERHEPTRGSLAGEVTALAREREAPLDVIRGFVEAVAVPKAALDELRNIGFFATPETVRAKIKSLFAAIDAANGDPR